MKNWIFTAILIVTFGAGCMAQESELNESILTYSCDELISQDLKKETITLTGNANLKTSVFEFLNAEKIVINRITKEIIVTGEFKINLNSGTIQKSTELKLNRLRYKIGEKIAYLE